MSAVVTTLRQRDETVPAASALGPVELTVVVPTFNEAGSVDRMVAALNEALVGIEWEVLFVDDDSPDGTSERVRELAQQDRRVRCVQRIGRRGLSSACIEGFLASTAPYIAVIDGDMQHDETVLPVMLRRLRETDLDLVSGSRFVAGATEEGLPSERRRKASALGNRLAQVVTHAELTDPLSGFFMLRRASFSALVRNLSGLGFKILIDILASAERPLRVAELPYRFRPRETGESKLDALVVWEYALLLLDKLVGRWVPVRFLLFSLIGAVGVAVHMSVLFLGFKVMGSGFDRAQIVAAVAAMTFNFFANNAFTYRDRRLRGRRLLTGLLSFYAVCGVGAVANIGIAAVLFHDYRVWWVAGFAGVLVGSVWNFAATSALTWRERR